MKKMHLQTESIMLNMNFVYNDSIMTKLCHHALLYFLYLMSLLPTILLVNVEMSKFNQFTKISITSVATLHLLVIYLQKHNFALQYQLNAVSRNFYPVMLLKLSNLKETTKSEKIQYMLRRNQNYMQNKSVSVTG